jgi:polyhydroxyalkanoate synthesis regulator phasin
VTESAEERLAQIEKKYAAMREVTKEIIEQLRAARERTIEAQAETIATLRAQIVELKAKRAEKEC